MYTLNDFFCGCGGIAVGFKAAGWEIVGAWDFDKYAVQTYRENVGAHVIQADITQMTIADVPIATAWAFGFPCTDLSYAGLGAGMEVKCKLCGTVWKYDTDKAACTVCGSDSFKAANRSGLFFEIMRLLDEAAQTDPAKLPLILMAENVKALRPYLPVLIAEYEKRGYTAQYTLLNSKYWGVPQNRERYFVIGVWQDVQGAYSFPIEQHDYIPRLSSALDTQVDEKYYVSDEKARRIIEQALQRLAGLGRVHATITPDRMEKQQNGRRAKPDEEEMFTLTAQDLHGVICQETGLLNPEGTSKTLRVGGTGSLSKKHNYEHVLVESKPLVPNGDQYASALIHSRGLETRIDGVCHCLKAAEGGSSKNFVVEDTVQKTGGAE